MYLLQLQANRTNIMTSETVELRLMKAERLRPMSKNKGDCDAYAVMILERTGEEHRTSVCYNTVFPRWYEVKKFTNVRETDTILVELWDNSMLGQHEKIGSAKISMAIAFKQHNVYNLNATGQRELSEWYHLENSGGKFSVVLVLEKENESLSRLAPSRNFVRFVNRKFRPRIDNSVLTKTAKGALDMVSSITRQIHPILDLSVPVDHHLAAHSTYTIKLDYVNSIFNGKTQGWSRDYIAAQRIFSGPMSGSLKTALLTQHDYFYGKFGKNSPIASIRKDLSQVTGAILDSEDLFQIINFGKREGKSRLFTYVIVENELRFCETDANNIHKDMDSKHAMHSRASPSVVYAGEFLIKDGKLIVDNASGTYAPSAELLPKLKQLLQVNFFGIQVEAFDFKSEELKRFKKLCIRE